MLYLITLQMYELEFRVKQSKLMWLYAMLPTNIDVRVAVDILLADGWYYRPLKARDEANTMHENSLS